MEIAKVNSDPSIINGGFCRPLKDIGKFVYETPMIVTVSLVTGIALIFFKSLFSIPLLFLATAAVLSRIIIKVVGRVNPEVSKVLQNSIYKIKDIFVKILYLITGISLILLSFYSPNTLLFSTSIVSSSCLGIAKGVIIELETVKYNQILPGSDLKNPLSETILNVAIS